MKAVLLDIDNTLLSFDNYVKGFMRTEFERYNLLPYDDSMFSVFTRVNGGLWQALEKGEVSFDVLKQNRWNFVFKELGIDFDGIFFEKQFRAGLLESAIPESGAMELLEYLSKKYILCAASNGPYHQQVNRLKVGEMLPYFTHIFISEKMGCSKPSADYFNICMERLGEGISPDEVMIIGDSPSSDMAGGINFGLKTCFYNPSGKAVDIKPDYTVRSLKEIENIL